MNHYAPLSEISKKAQSFNTLFDTASKVVILLAAAAAFILNARLAPVVTRLDAVEKEISKLPIEYQSKDISDERWKNNDERHLEIIAKIDRLTVAVNNLYTKVK